MMFRVGQELECVDAAESGKSGSHLEKGRVYICTGSDNDPGGPWVGVDCCAKCDDPKHRWYPRRFRPIVTREYSIEIFTRLLTPADTKVDA
jgi:hypothetical protein